MEEVMEKRRWEQFKAEHRRKPKRKPEEAETLPAGWMRQPKRLKRMETEEAAQEEEFDITGWWKWAEERCIRVGELRRRLETDRIRVLRMMESRSQDLILQQKA